MASAAVLFPGAAALLKVEFAPEQSTLTHLYGVLLSIIASFALLFTTTFVKPLAKAKTARLTALISMASALCLLFAFIAIRSSIVNVISQVVTHPRPGQTLTIVRVQGRVSRNLSEDQATKAPVEVKIPGSELPSENGLSEDQATNAPVEVKIPPGPELPSENGLSEDRAKDVAADEDVSSDSEMPTGVLEDSDYGDPWDTVALACFVAAFTGITIAFTTLGIHHHGGIQRSNQAKQRTAGRSAARLKDEL